MGRMESREYTAVLNKECIQESGSGWEKRSATGGYVAGWASRLE